MLKSHNLHKNKANVYFYWSIKKMHGLHGMYMHFHIPSEFHNHQKHINQYELIPFIPRTSSENCQTEGRYIFIL